jgi:hypothetical protein
MNHGFEKKLYLRCGIFFVFVIFGLVSIVISLTPGVRISDFSRGYLSGMGFGMTTVGIVTLVKLCSVLRNERKLRAKRIEEQDERNALLNTPSSHISLLVMIFGLYIASIYYAFVDETILHLLSTIILLTLAVKMISYLLLKKRM